MRRLFTFILLSLGMLSLQAEDRVFESGPQRTHLIELFTSQGCSSCPPAEAWLSTLKSQPGLWKAFVPVAFHVDYWDGLGWRDPFASKNWTARQYQYSQSWKSENVYTPAFVLDGREWLGRSVPTSGHENAGVLKLLVNNNRIVAEFSAVSGDANDLDLHVATLGFDLASKVTAGENSGRNLRQDFVVLGVTDEKMSRGKAEFHFLPDARGSAIAAWVTLPNRMEPIQALGGWLR